MYSNVPIYYPFSTFSIVYARTTHQQPPAGPDAGQRQSFLFGSVPCTAGLRFEAGPLGGDEIVGAGESPPTKIHLTRGLFLFSFLKINFYRLLFRETAH